MDVLAHTGRPNNLGIPHPLASYKNKCHYKFQVRVVFCKIYQSYLTFAKRIFSSQRGVSEAQFKVVHIGPLSPSSAVICYPRLVLHSSNLAVD